MNWDDLKVLLAISRAGSRAGAARLLSVDTSTVARRLAALQRALGENLTEPDGNGRITLTEAGRTVAARAERMDDLAREITGPADAPRSWVRVTAVPLVVNHLFLPNLPAFEAACPQIGLELIAEARDLSLAHHDADIAVRLARPRTGGQAVLARQIGQLRYAAYCARGAQEPLPWIGYDRAMQYLSHAAALHRAAQQPGQSLARLAVNDGETLFQAVLAGQGKSLLPVEICDRHPGLQRVEAPADLPGREVWLMVRRDLRHLERIEAVTGWLEDLFRSASGPPAAVREGSPG